MRRCKKLLPIFSIFSLFLSGWGNFQSQLAFQLAFSEGFEIEKQREFFLCEFIVGIENFKVFESNFLLFLLSPQIRTHHTAVIAWLFHISSGSKTAGDFTLKCCVEKSLLNDIKHYRLDSFTCLEKFDREILQNLVKIRSIRFKSSKMISSAYTSSTDDDEHEFSLRTRPSVAASFSHILNCASVDKSSWWWSHRTYWKLIFFVRFSNELFRTMCNSWPTYAYIFQCAHTKEKKGDLTHAGVLQNTLDWWCYKKKVYSRRLTLSLAACLPMLFAIVTDNSPAVCWICYTTFFCAISVTRKKNDTADNNTRVNSR